MLDYRRVLVDTVDAFDTDHGTETPVPALDIVDGSYTPVEDVGNDRGLVAQEDYTIRIGDEGFIGEGERRDWEEDQLRAYYRSCIDQIYRDAAASLLEDAAAEIDERYSSFETSIEIDDVSFRDDRSTAAFTRSQSLVKLPAAYRDDIDPVEPAVDSVSTWSSFLHETVHALHFTTSDEASGLAATISASIGDDASYKDDVRRAAMEAITKYEEPDPGSKRVAHEETLAALQHPWKLDELDIEPEGLYSDDPYELGHLAAYAVDTAFTEEYGSEEGGELTREFLLNAVTTPTGLEGAIDSSFELRGVPNYPRLFQEYYSELEGTEDLDNAALETAHTLDRELAQLDPDKILDGVIAARAFLDAYDEHAEGDNPHRISELATTVETAENVFGPD